MAKDWSVDNDVLPDNTLHVWPNNDLHAHAISVGEHCWCKPRLEEQPNGIVMVVHKSADQRERFEVNL
jgi:hypothetical protein